MATDPFAGKPFVYRTQPQVGFQLYSVGANRLADGGRLVAPDTPNGDLLPISLRALPKSIRPKSPQAQTPAIWLR